MKNGPLFKGPFFLPVVLYRLLMFMTFKQVWIFFLEIFINGGFE